MSQGQTYLFPLKKMGTYVSLLVFESLWVRFVLIRPSCLSISNGPRRIRGVFVDRTRGVWSQKKSPRPKVFEDLVHRLLELFW